MASVLLEVYRQKGTAKGIRNARYAFDVEVARTLSEKERWQLRAIVDYMKPAQMGWRGVGGSPASEVVARRALDAPLERPMRQSSLKLLPVLLLLASHQAVAEAPRFATVAERIQLIRAMKDCWTQRTGDGSVKATKGGGDIGLRVDGAFKKLLSVAADAKGNFDFRTTTWQEFDAIKAPQNVDVMLRLCYEAAFGNPPDRQTAPTSARTTPRALPVRIKAASIDRKDVSPDVCLAKTPCGGLKRGSSLHLELTGAGYAATYIQDKGAFFNQEGRLAINNGFQGDVGLFPGTEEGMDGSVGSVYVLYVVFSDTRIPTTPDSQGLERLPRGEHFGPIYLRVGAE